MTPFGRRILKIKHENLVSSRSLSGYSMSVPPDRESIAVSSLNSGLGFAIRNEPNHAQDQYGVCWLNSDLNGRSFIGWFL